MSARGVSKEDFIAFRSSRRHEIAIFPEPPNASGAWRRFSIWAQAVISQRVEMTFPSRVELYSVPIGPSSDKSRIGASLMQKYLCGRQAGKCSRSALGAGAKLYPLFLMFFVAIRRPPDLQNLSQVPFAHPIRALQLLSEYVLKHGFV